MIILYKRHCCKKRNTFTVIRLHPICHIDIYFFKIDFNIALPLSMGL